MSNWGTVTLMGSGELTDSMVKVHRALLARAGANPCAVFLDTPAGFELNADQVSARAVDYFQQRFNIELAIASFKSKKLATPRSVENTLHLLHRANFIFAGPGSPSYAIHHWRGSAVWDMLLARLMDGAQLVLASAGAIATGSFALPVYEIYKAGHAVEWIDGLDLFGMFGLKLALVPHWNNTEGGTYDTRYCWMGEPRLKVLETQLPFDVVIVGIDEHTACTFDLAKQECSVNGIGGVTVRYQGREEFYPAGATVSFERLRMNAFTMENTPALLTAPIFPSPQLIRTKIYLSQLSRAMEQAHALDADGQRELIDHAHDTMHELAQTWRVGDQLVGEEIAPFVELLINTRNELRAAKQFALADAIRQQLTAMGIALEDSPNGTTWKRIET